MASPSLLHRVVENVRIFTIISLTGFGGPAANIVYLKRVFVTRLAWLDESTFADLFALSSALPGPSYLQLAFSIALLRGGLICGLLAIIVLTLPGSLVMFGLAIAVRHFPSQLPDVVPPLFSGLNSAAVGLIALAGYSLSKSSAKTTLNQLILFATGAIPTVYSSTWLFPTLIAVSGLLTWANDEILLQLRSRSLRPRNPVTPPPEEVPMQTLPQAESGDSKAVTPMSADAETTLTRRTVAEAGQSTPAVTEPTPADPPPEPLHFGLSIISGLIVLVASIIAAVTLVAVRYTIQSPRSLSLLVNFLIAGTIIFGGGGVVIPLLKGYTVDYGWVEPREFLLGFGILQALPGPVFNLAVYLGALALPHNPALGGIIGYVGLYLPGILLKLSLLPLYSRFRSHRAVRSVLSGLTAGGVGLIWGALYKLWSVGFVVNGAAGDTKSLDESGWWLVVAAGSFLGCEWLGAWPPFAIAGGALAGISWWGVTKD